MINEKEERREVSAGEVRAVFYLRIIALLAVAVTCVCSVLILPGVTTAYGKALNIATTIEFLADVMNIGKMDLYLLASRVILAIAYICAVLMLIKGLVDAFRSLSAVFSRKSSYGDCVKQTHLLSRGCGKTCATLIGLHVFSVVLADGAPTELYYIVLLLGAAFSMLAAVLSAMPKLLGHVASDESPLGLLICAVLRQAFLLAFGYCMLVYLVQPVGYRVVMDLHVLFGGVFNGVYGFFNIVTAMLGPDVLCLVACFMFLSVCKYLLTGFFDTDLVVTGEGSMRQWSMRIFVVMLIGAVLLCFTTLFDAEFRFHFDVAMFSLWWELLLPCYIPVLLASCMNAIASSQGGTAL